MHYYNANIWKISCIEILCCKSDIYRYFDACGRFKPLTWTLKSFWKQSLTMYFCDIYTDIYAIIHLTPRRTVDYF